MIDPQAQREVWNTKSALTEGVSKIRGRVVTGGYFVVDGGPVVLSSEDWADSEDAARAQVEKKLAAQKRKIARLQKNAERVAAVLAEGRLPMARSLP